MDIVEFLRARLDEDEAAARDGFSYGPPARVLREVEVKRRIVDDLATLVPYQPHEDYDNTDNVWAEIQADRAERHLRLLASVHAEHPDYDEKWRM